METIFQHGPFAIKATDQGVTLSFKRRMALPTLSPEETRILIQGLRQAVGTAERYQQLAFKAQVLQQPLLTTGEGDPNSSDHRQHGDRWVDATVDEPTLEGEGD